MGRAAVWAIAIGCFALLVQRIDGAAQRQGQDLFPYLLGIFARVDWPILIGLLIPYSLVFFLLDSAAVWRAVNWFNAPVRYRDILPVRASTYILSILNEQVGKGAMALYLQRREGVPGWKLGSSMLFLMFCEFYYLLAWATLGWSQNKETLPAAFDAIPIIAAGAAAFLLVFLLYFRGALLPRLTLRDQPLFFAFREARPWQYLTIIAIKSPALLTAVLVYDVALRLLSVSS